MKKIALTILACAAVCACTSEKVSTPDVQKTFDGDVAYMTVRISDVGSTTRATDGGYANGSSAEYAVGNAFFYFYDAAGVFVSEAEVWDGGEATDNKTGNVEFEGSTVIVLKGLTGTGYPNYVVTVLNRPDNFTQGSTLSAMAELLSDASGVGINDAAGNFVMSTSSYVDGTADARAACFVTPVTEDDFFPEPVDINADGFKPVDIYVERLAAKVETGISLTPDATTGMYPLTETVAGDANEQSGGGSEGDETIYVKINGWALNGTAKHSNMVKDVTGFSTTDGIDGWTGWNVPGDFRSYWGKSFNYGLGFGQYPTTSGGATDGTALNDWLDYVSYNDLTFDFDRNGTNYYTYCAENTNTAGGNGDGSAVIQSKNSAAITNVLVAAEVCDADGNGLDLVRYHGELFTRDAFLNYVMTELQATGAADWNVYTVDETTGEAVYSQIDATYLTLGKSITSGENKVTRYDGYVVVLADEGAFKANTYYCDTGETDTDGNPVMEAYGSVEAAIAAVDDELYAFDAANDNINAFTGGLMYYHIPIEHLNNNEGTDGIPLEANYGIVRNHWYRLTITSIENLGKGVFDPDEVIIPNIDDEQYYYVGARINILSWKLVSQDVVL